MLNSPVIAVFDFDKTLTTRDSLLPLLIYKEGWIASLYKLVCLVPGFIAFLLHFLSRQQIKEKILKSFFGGMSWEELKGVALSYATHQLDRYVRPEALKRVKWHQQQGHRCILISASLEVYLKPWARRHGFHEVLASQLDLKENQVVTGKLVGKNCWGAEKKRRLLELLGPKEKYQLYVYGDSQGDYELLEIADYPFYRKFC